MFELLKDRLAVKRDLAEASLGSIYILEKSREKLNTGEVVYIGPDVLDVKIGDKVMFGKNDGSAQTIENQDLIILKENMIWGVLNA